MDTKVTSQKAQSTLKCKPNEKRIFELIKKRNVEGIQDARIF